MAKLNQIAESLNVNFITENTVNNASLTQKTKGQKRRSWLQEDDQNITNNGGNLNLQKGSINPVYKPHLSTPLINPIDKPLYENKAIKGVYKPLIISLHNLRGNPLKIAQYFFEVSKSNLEKITEKTTQSEIVKILDISKDSARTGLRFLLKNKLVERIYFHPGKFGWSKYKLNDNLFCELELHYSKGSIGPLSAKPITIIDKGFNNSNSNNITTTINTNNKPLLGWDNIDISNLEIINFTKNHLLQLKLKNTPDIVQESINHFSYGLKYNPKLKKYSDPLNVLMGVLRKGQAWVESNYESPQVIAQRQLLEQKKKEKENLDKLQEEAFKMAFNEWKIKKDKKELESIGGTPEIINKIMVTPEDKIKNYFKKNIWETVKKEYLINGN